MLGLTVGNMVGFIGGLLLGEHVRLNVGLIAGETEGPSIGLTIGKIVGAVGQFDAKTHAICISSQRSSYLCMVGIIDKHKWMANITIKDPLALVSCMTRSLWPSGLKSS